MADRVPRAEARVTVNTVATNLARIAGEGMDERSLAILRQAAVLRILANRLTD